MDFFFCRPDIMDQFSTWTGVEDDLELESTEDGSSESSGRTGNQRFCSVKSWANEDHPMLLLLAAKARQAAEQEAALHKRRVATAAARYIIRGAMAASLAQEVRRELSILERGESDVCEMRPHSPRHKARAVGMRPWLLKEAAKIRRARACRDSPLLVRALLAASAIRDITCLMHAAEQAALEQLA
mmetsp:Transcript_14375/g.25274  ORF Transcript_14375/g.25274 Transcript_14375/m.25274 type:complete len:186 (+) Transcript_14375:103-660(+)